MKTVAIAQLPAARRWLGRATEPHILFPAIAIVLLTMIWGTTANLVAVERAAAETAAATSTRELAETYEAQVVRALREIDQTLKLVQFAYGVRGRQVVLGELKARTLLPPDLLFVVSITDDKGEIVATTRASATTNVADQIYFWSQRQSDALFVGSPQRQPSSGKWMLHFTRRLAAADGHFAGIAMVEVDAAYFVSGYEDSKLGNHGLLALLGTDGVFRVRRSGATLSAGDWIDYSWILPATDTGEGEARLVTDSWDGVRRYAGVRPLYGFPLAVIVGLSYDEQLAPTQRRKHDYLLLALAGSLALVAIIAVLGRMSAKLAAGRRRAVQEQMKHAERVEYLAFHDGLTTLPNRSLFSRLLSRNISLAKRQQGNLAVLFLDLDRFKHINDTLGHESGDLLLQEVAARLRSCLRASDTVARIGGDEFVALLPELGEDAYVSTVARKILSAIARPYVLLGQEFRVTASVGIAVYPRDGVDEQTLTKNADIAMYKAKEEGKNTFRFYSENLNRESLERLTLESRLRHAIERDEFRLHYQAKRDVRSGRITGMEALLRWEHPDLGIVAPMQFIPVAEESGLIVPIGKWVLRTACLQNVDWQALGLPRLGIAVNLSARQFLDEHLLADLAAILAETGMDAPLLELEIAESLLMRDVDRALRVLADLKAMGVRIAVDDFGLGYSSLASFRRFPIDTLKIDRSLIRDVGGADEDKDLAGAIIAMGRTLSQTLVAQGVETKEQADFLRRNACDEIQGFYFNKPVPADQFTKLLLAEAKASVSDTLSAA